MTRDAELEPWTYPHSEEPPALAHPIRGTSRTFGDFLAWAYADVLESQARGILAEYLVKEGLQFRKPYLSGDFYDLRYRGGVQVKASSAVQRWTSEKVHRISFGTRKVRGSTNADEEHATSRLTDEPKHWGKAWVFAVLRPSTVEDLDTAREETLDVSTWRYWVADPRAIRRIYKSPAAKTPGYEPKRVTLLSVIANLGAGIGWDELKAAVDRQMDADPTLDPGSWDAKPNVDDWIAEERMHVVPEGALDAVKRTVERLGAGVTFDFWPGVVRAQYSGGGRIDISFEYVNDLKARAARLLGPRGVAENGEGRSGRGDVLPWSDLPERVFAHIRGGS